MRAREIAVGYVPLLASRVTYVGELGWELYAPAEYGLGLYDLLSEAGAPHGLRGGGYRAIESMRLEKGYRAWGSDLTPETTPEAAGLGFAVRLDKAAPFIGQDALRAERAGRRPAPSGWPVSCSRMPRSVCLGSEPVRIAGELCGRVTSGGYGSRVRAASRSPTCPRRTLAPARAPRSRSSASGWRPRSSRARSTIRPGERIRA